MMDPHIEIIQRFSTVTCSYFLNQPEWPWTKTFGYSTLPLANILPPSHSASSPLLSSAAWPLPPRTWLQSNRSPLKLALRKGRSAAVLRDFPHSRHASEVCVDICLPKKWPAHVAVSPADKHIAGCSAYRRSRTQERVANEAVSSKDSDLQEEAWEQTFVMKCVRCTVSIITVIKWHQKQQMKQILSPNPR